MTLWTRESSSMATSLKIVSLKTICLISRVMVSYWISRCRLRIGRLYCLSRLRNLVRTRHRLVIVLRDTSWMFLLSLWTFRLLVSHRWKRRRLNLSRTRLAKIILNIPRRRRYILLRMKKVMLMTLCLFKRCLAALGRHRVFITRRVPRKVS